MWPGKRDGNEANVQKVRSMCREESGVRSGGRRIRSGKHGRECDQVSREGMLAR